MVNAMHACSTALSRVPRSVSIWGSWRREGRVTNPISQPLFCSHPGLPAQIMPQIALPVPSFNDHIPFAVIKSHLPSENRAISHFTPSASSYLGLFGSSRNVLNLMSKLWVVAWVKEGVFRSPQSSKVQFSDYRIAYKNEWKTKKWFVYFQSFIGNKIFEYWDRGHLVSMVDEGMRIRVTVVIFATGKTEQFAVCGHVIPT